MSQGSIANAAIERAKETGSLVDFYAARAAVGDIGKARSRVPYTKALGSLPLADPPTRMVAIAVERTLDMSRTQPHVVGEDNGNVVVALRRGETVRDGRAALDVVATVDRASGAVALTGATLTHDFPGVDLPPLPVSEGRLDVTTIRGWDNDVRRAYALPASLLATGTELQSPQSPPLPLG
jgi:hypothetical protein